MGLFYANLTVYGPPQFQVKDALRRLGRTAFVSPTIDGYTVVCDQVICEQGADEIESLGCAVTAELSCPALAALLHDDDVLFLWLFRDGQVLDFYDSLPGYFDAEAEPGSPEGGNGPLYCEAFDRPGRQERVELLLRVCILDEDRPEIPGEQERHRAIADELGMPPFVAAIVYEAIAEGYVPEEFREIAFEAVVPDRAA